ncbi:uncharacterized protein LOC123506444 isoform X1 [Portunus trituberculatus]|uniref:uncharacterized protein LOC123506444 isoform X1 n=1 Tax=Portunus trituberculatus TaxID=210409 RepID=UPI001E1CF413|nr:uncharacterized protein LOC123506444 isoform X1 [Portunus trituberculatus]XP_045114469.1 uncharacterized protein LOC123506444 isoform X1 [Portunus trituberculatus]XP_045114470.1 uncharacterized protein LOC123506444 isoform X1 [Portunus trituberculatus]
MYPTSSQGFHLCLHLCRVRAVSFLLSSTPTSTPNVITTMSDLVLWLKIHLKKTMRPASSEQVVSYSYLAAPQGQSHSKDVVYGSGAAAKPPSSGHSFSARSPTLGQTLTVETKKSDHAALGHASGHTHLSITPPVITAFESSKLSHVSPSPLVHSSSSSAPSPFFSSSFSPSPTHSSPPPPSLPPASPFTHPEAIFAMHQTSATVHPADPSQFIIKDSTFQPFPGSPTFTVPLPVPHNQITGHPATSHIKREQLVQAGSEALSSYSNYQGSTERPIYHRVMDPLRKVGQRIYKVASPVLKPMMDAGHRLSERLQLNKRVNAISESLHLDSMNKYISRTVDSEALPVVAGVGAITAIGLAVLAVAAATNSTTIIGKRSIEDDSTLYFLDKLHGGSTESKDRLGDLLAAPLMAHAFSSSSTWCSKRVICDVMTYLPDHYLFAFEKELQLFLDMLNSGRDEDFSLKKTADGFLKAVKQKQCDQYTCGDEQVDSSQILPETSGPR